MGEGRAGLHCRAEVVMTDDERDAMVEGIYKATLEYLTDNQTGFTSVPEMITEGVAKATREWLDDNEAEVLAAIKSAHGDEG
jgi:hypothetical protein